MLQDKHTIAAFEIMEDDNQIESSRLIPCSCQQPVVKGLCAVRIIKVKGGGGKRGYVIFPYSTNEDGDMFLLFLCALVIRVHEMGR